MKELLKSRVFVVIVIACVCIVGTAYAAVSILASNINYTPKDTSWKKTNGDNIVNVQDAIDELYDKSNLETTIEKKYCDSGENALTCTIDNLDINKYYFCIATYRGTNSNFNVTNANVIYNEHNWNYLDINSTYRTLINPISSSVTFTATSSKNGLKVVCYHIINIH
ncbi:MAG: hypothetical protein IJ715_04240 [Bacilli bacterium]|nr:hypothetical protein [Bacilli bacterium]